MSAGPDTPLAKLSRPRLFDALPRERLFARLDHLRRHPALWVSGPPGAGKTTLAGSWIDARCLPAIWYHIDGGDADPATFFYYLGRAAARNAAETLPLLTPEYLPDLEGFTRRFFRTLFGLLPAGSVLAFDNMHEVAAESAMHQVLAWAFTEVPAGINVLAISRAEPVPVYARALASGLLATLDADALRLTLAEAREIAALRDAGVGDAPVEQFHARCGGWAAGLTLMLERARRTPALSALETVEATRQAVFDYFAGEILDKMPLAHRAALMAVALLPQVTASEAAEMAGDPEAVSLLEWLYRRQMFVDRRVEAQPSYRLHDLFREFLLARAAQAYSADERAGLSRRAAGLLAAAGRYEDAAKQCRDAGDWDALAELVMGQAPALLAQGRGATLREWVGYIPVPVGTANPWLDYWAGTSLIGTDTRQARAFLERAYSAFGHAADPRGWAQAACGVVESLYFEMSDDMRLDAWVPVMERALEARDAFATPDDEIRVYASLVSMLIRRRPADPNLERHAGRLVDLLGGPGEINQKVSAAGMVLQYLHFQPKEETLQRLRSSIDPVVVQPGVLPVHRIHYGVLLAFALHRYGHGDDAQVLIAATQALAGQEGLAAIVPFATFLEHVILLANARPEVKAHLGRFEDLVNALGDAAAYAWCGLLWGKTSHAMLRQDADESLRLALATVEAADRIGMVFQQGRTRRSLVEALVEVGDYEAAARTAAESRAIAQASGFAWLEEELDLVEAYACLKQEREDEAAERLTRTLARMHAAGAMADHLDYTGLRIRSTLYAFALERGIEAAYVREIIERYRIRPYGYAGAVWPWPVRIRTLGGFSAEVGGEPLRFGRKAPRRVLDLLKAVICFGGVRVPLERVYDALWPDSEADAAHEAFATALHRLRKLLGGEETIVLRDGKLGLSSEHCWVDALALEASLAEATRTKNAPDMQRLIAAYSGTFLPEDTDVPWTARLRDRLRRGFADACTRAATALEDEGALESAAALYARAIECEELSEALHRALMRCHLRLGRAADAAAVYGRLCERLAAHLGIAPGAETRALFERVRAAPPGA